MSQSYFYMSANLVLVKRNTVIGVYCFEKRFRCPMQQKFHTFSLRKVQIIIIVNRPRTRSTQIKLGTTIQNAEAQVKKTPVCIVIIINAHETVDNVFLLAVNATLI